MLPGLCRAFVFLVLSAALGAAITFFRAPDLAALKREATQGSDPRELAATITKVVLKQGGKQTLDEGDLNAYFSNSIAARLEHSPAFVKPCDIACDLRDDSARLYLTWRVFDHPVTAAVDVTLVRVGAEIVCEVTGGSYGRLAVPRLCLTPVRPALRELARACQPEVQALLSLPRLSIAKEKLVLDPVF